MINHISLPAGNPEKVANILAELFGGVAMPFPPSPGGFVAFADDDRGTLVEVVPSDVHLVPGEGLPDEENFTRETITDENEAVFVPGNERSLFGSVHLNINSPLDEESIKAIAKREGWRCLKANRGRGLFQLIELWIENRFLVEVNTPEMTKEYQETVTAANWAAFLDMPLPPRYADNYAGLVG